MLFNKSTTKNLSRKTTKPRTILTFDIMEIGIGLVIGLVVGLVAGYFIIQVTMKSKKQALLSEVTEKTDQEIRKAQDTAKRILDEAEEPFAPASPPLTKLPDLLGTPGGFFIRGITIPNGTQLAARYKGQTYRHDIAKGQWMDSNGQTFDSPSSAASSITGNNVNGWRFWLALRPSDSQWRRLDQLLVR